MVMLTTMNDCADDNSYNEIDAEYLPAAMFAEETIYVWLQYSQKLN